MRIAIGGFSHETNTFCSAGTDLDAFRLRDWSVGPELIQRNQSVRNYLGGMIAACDDLGVESVPAFFTSAEPSGLIEREAFEHIEENLLRSLEAAGPVDAVCLALHGAGVAEGIDDLEGRILTKVRELVGLEIPVAATFDLHGNVFQESLDAASALFGVHLYPHTDAFDRGFEAVRTLTKIVSEEIRPTMHLTKIPMLIASATTDHPPASEVNELCWQWESEPNVLDCTFFHGFAYADIPGAGAGVLTITDNDPDLAARISGEVAREVWARREEFRPVITPPEKVFEIADQDDGRPVIIHESADNPGGGGPGDGTHLLRAMLDANLQDACFGFIFDPETVEQAHSAGVGNDISVVLGGKYEPLHGEPIECSAYVKCLTDGKFIQRSPMGQGAKVDLGRMARLTIGGVDVLVSSVRTQTLDDEVFRLHGIDVTEYKYVAIKSANHFRAAFNPIAHRIIRADTPGVVSADTSTFDYRRLTRPIWPLDDDVRWP